jgi:16S rRNA (uracil1498-N3)-methyltransferase
MALRRIFVDWIRDGAAGVGGSRAHHLARVARLRAGEAVEITDQRELFLATVKTTAAGQVEFAVVEQLAAPAPPFPVVLQAAIFKFPRFEWIIEKAAELGVQRIVPIAAGFSERGLVQAAAKRRARWQKIAEEAAQQSRRLASPPVEEVCSLEQAIAGAAGPLRLFLDSNSPPLADLLRAATAADAAALGEHCVGTPAYLLVGPEGGWTDSERERARAGGYQAAGLGSGILRAETAALAALAIVTHLLPAPPAS